jgi:hypothetical protein
MTHKHAVQHAVHRAGHGQASPQEAFRHLVYSQPSVAEVAALMGMRPGTLYNKADADEHSHNQPTLRDVVLLTRITGNPAVLDALCALFGRATFDCRPYANASDEHLLELLANLGTEHGQFCSALTRALRGERLTAAALHQVRCEGFDIVEALMTLLVRLEGLADDAEPARG